MPTVTWSSSVQDTMDHKLDTQPLPGNQPDGGPLGTASKEEDLHKSSGILAWYSKQLVKLPVAIAMCVVLLLLTAVCGAVSLLAFDPPDFSQPSKGFEARGTDINGKMLSYYNIYGRDSGLSSVYIVDSSNGSSSRTGETRAPLLNGPSNDGMGRARRDATQGGGNQSSTSGVQFCGTDWSTGGENFEPPAIVFEAVDSHDLFSRKALVSLCQHDEAMRASAALNKHCCTTANGGEGAACASSWSLGNYVALFAGREECADIRDEDVDSLKQLLVTCSPYYRRKALQLCSREPQRCPPDVPAQCLLHDGAVPVILRRLVPSAFSIGSGGRLASTILYLPFWGYYRDLYDEAIRDRAVDDGVTRLAGLGFGLLKYDLFGDSLLSDTLYIGIGAGLVFLIVWAYTSSLFVTLMTILGMLMTLVVAYFAFVAVFRLPFFPFVNVASAVLIIGVGADDTFVYVDIWRQNEAATPGAARSAILRETLRHASATMFVTSLTTASALYSTAVSSITAVRCFGVYAGTAVLVNFGLTLTWLPAVVVLRARLRDWWTSLSGRCRCSGGDGVGVGVGGGGGGGGRGFFGRLHAAVSGAYGLVFQRYLPAAVLGFRYLWIVALVSVGAGAFCVVYVSPGLRLPASAEFQVFRDGDLFERFDQHYKPAYDFGTDAAGPLFLAAVFGLEGADTGDPWDPDDQGSLGIMDDFDMHAPDSQRWLLDFCLGLRRQGFYDEGLDRAPCFMESVRTAMEAPCYSGAHPLGPPCCGHADFPFPPEVLEECVRAVRTCDTATSPCRHSIQPGPLFGLEDGSVKAFLMLGYSTRRVTMEYGYIDDFWTEANDWLDGRLQTRPGGIKGGWIYAGSRDGLQLSFYNLQRSLSESTPVSMALSLALAAVVLLLTTWNLLLSLYAMVSIAGAFCVTVGTLVLLGWRLNVFESAILTLAVGLSVDFTIHYGVAYRLAPGRRREERAAGSLAAVGSAITVAALSTFVAGAAMMPSRVLSYAQLGTFLMLVMGISWVYATFLFLSLCRVVGPIGRCGQVPFPSCLCRRQKPSDPEDDRGTRDPAEASASTDHRPPSAAGAIVPGDTLPVGCKSTATNGDASTRPSAASAMNQTDPEQMDAGVWSSSL